MTPSSIPLTARAEGGSHDGEEFDIAEETVGVLLNSRRDAAVAEYYELVLYMRGNALIFVREYGADERRVAFGAAERRAERPTGV
jgi:hypothetical protein